MILGFAIALQFLTIVPVRLRAAVGDAELSRAMGWYPVIGALLGLVVAGVYLVSGRYISPGVAPVLAVATAALLTGGLHLDGVADCADAAGAVKTREERLRIMDDPHLGAMGAAAIVIVLLLKCALIASLPGKTAWMALVAALAASRAGILVPAIAFPYARRDTGGTGSFLSQLRGETVAIAVILAAVLAGGLFPVPGLIATAAAIAGAWLTGWAASRVLGGVTGDVLGAANEVGELAWLAAFIAASRALG